MWWWWRHGLDDGFTFWIDNIFFLEGMFRSSDYIKLLKDRAIPIMYLNCGKDFTFQQDNSPVYNSKECKKIFNESNIMVLQWPAISPDINIVEDM